MSATLEPNRCPCIVKKKDGSDAVCGRPVKANGKCGIHKNTCRSPRKSPKKPVLEPEPAPELEEVQEPALAVQEPAPTPKLIPQVQPAPGTCPCVVVTRKGERKICGRPIKGDGVCGIHGKKCNMPDQQKEEEVEQARKPIVAAEFEESKVFEEKCPCIVKARKKGEEDRMCGNKVKENGRCGIHRNTCIRGDEVTSCPCITKKTGKVCGRKVKAFGKCVFHQKTCDLPKAEEKQEVEAEDEVEVEAALQESASIVDRDVAASAVPGTFPEPEVIIAEEEVAPQLPQDWKYATVENIQEIYSYITNLPEEKVLGDVDLTDQILTYLRQ